MRILLKIVCFLILISLRIYAQNEQPRVEVFTDTSKIRIGEQVKLDIYVYIDAKSNTNIVWPAINDTLTEKIEVLSTSRIDTMLPDKNNASLIRQHQQLIISVYDSGYYVIPPFKFIVNGDTSKPLLSEALLLEVHTVPTDSSLTKTKDIKEPFGEPFNWRWYKDYIYIFISGIIVAAILFGIIYTLNKKRKQKIVEPEKPKIPAHILALTALEKIKQEQIWKEGKNKEYYSSITDTLRLYLEQRYGINALESTTDEILQIMKNQVVDPVSMEKLRQILILSDFVKFAKMMPVEQEHQLTLQNAFDFVNGTKREEEYSVEELKTSTEEKHQPV